MCHLKEKETKRKEVKKGGRREIHEHMTIAELRANKSESP
jgi:hypothetical protein